MAFRTVAVSDSGWGFNTPLSDVGAGVGGHRIEVSGP